MAYGEKSIEKLRSRVCVLQLKVFSLHSRQEYLATQREASQLYTDIGKVNSYDYTELCLSWQSAVARIIEYCSWKLGK